MTTSLTTQAIAAIHLYCSLTFFNLNSLSNPIYLVSNQELAMYVTHHAHQHPLAGYRSASSNSASEDKDLPIPWPATGIVHLFPDTPISDIPESYTAGKKWTFVAGEGWFERGTYRFPQPKSEVGFKPSTPIRRQISYRRLTRSICVYSIFGLVLGYVGWRLVQASVGLLLYGWRRFL